MWFFFSNYIVYTSRQHLSEHPTKFIFIVWLEVTSLTCVVRFFKVLLSKVLCFRHAILEYTRLAKGLLMGTVPFNKTPKNEPENIQELKIAWLCWGNAEERCTSFNKIAGFWHLHFSLHFNIIKLCVQINTSHHEEIQGIQQSF